MAGSTICESVTPTKAAAAELALRVVGTEHDGRIVRLQAEKCTIGSAAGCTLRLKAPGVRDVQCLVVRGPSGLVVRNWAANTRLNGRRFDDAALAVGDRLSMGPIELEVLASAETGCPAASVPAIDRRRVVELEQKARDANRAREELAKKLAESEGFIASLNDRLAAADLMIADLGQQLAARSDDAAIPAQTLAEIETLRQQAELLAQQFAAARQQSAADRDEWQAERAKLQARVTEEENRVEAVSQAVEQARDEARQQCAAWEAERAQLTKDLEAARLKSAASVEKHREAREFEVAITHWRERAEEQTRLVEELQARLEQAPSAEAIAENEKLRAELEAGARELDAEGERLLEQQQSLEELAAAIEKEEQQLAAQRAAFDNEQFQHLAERESFDLERSQLLTERITFDAERVQYVADRATLDAQRASLLAERDELSRQIADLLARQQQSLEEQEELRRFAQNASEAAGRLEANTNAHELERSQFQSEREAFEAQRAQLEMERASLQQQREELTHQLAGLEARQQQALAAESVTASADVEVERSQLSSERAQLETAREALDADRASLADQREALARELAEYQTRQQQLLEELEALRAQASHAPESSTADSNADLIEVERARLQAERSALETEHAQVIEEWKAIEAEREGFRLEREAFAREAAELEARRQSLLALETRSPSEDYAAAEIAESQAYEPQSASDIIARLSASGMWKDDVPEGEEAVNDAAPEPAWKSLVSEAEQAPPPKPAPVSEEEDSIESYMKRLLQRVSGDGDAAPRWTPPAESDSSPSDPAAVTLPDSPTVEAEAFDPKTYVPRSTAPELNANLAAMRELANTSARSAIDTSSRRQQLRQAATKLSLSMIAVLTNFALWWLAIRSEGLLPFFASLMASLCSGAWFLSAAAKWLKARRMQKKSAAEVEETSST